MWWIAPTCLASLILQGETWSFYTRIISVPQRLMLLTLYPVGAGLPAMVVDDNAGDLDVRGALESIASRLAPTVFRRGHVPLWELACQRWSLTITRVNWINAARLSPSPASWLLQFFCVDAVPCGSWLASDGR